VNNKTLQETNNDPVSVLKRCVI